MKYSFLEHAIVFVAAFLLLEIVTLGWFFVTSRLSPRGSHDRLAVAVSRWNGGYLSHGFVMWQVAAFGSYYAVTGQA